MNFYGILPHRRSRCNANQTIIQYNRGRESPIDIDRREVGVNCWHCERPAHGICIFCGRALCKDCAREMPHIVAVYRDDRNVPRAIVTTRTLYCGICEPREDPIELPELK